MLQGELSMNNEMLVTMVSIVTNCFGTTSFRIEIDILRQKHLSLIDIGLKKLEIPNSSSRYSCITKKPLQDKGLREPNSVSVENIDARESYKAPPTKTNQNIKADTKTFSRRSC